MALIPVGCLRDAHKKKRCLNNNYYCIRTENDPELNEVIVALLSELPFDTFEETVVGIGAYIKVPDFTAEVEEQLSRIASDFGFALSVQEIEAQNWNEVWESNFQPLLIDDFCYIRAEFHKPVTNAQHEIIIQPNMAFGTGHHETTHLMIQQMREVNFMGKKVLDFGSGTGILSILSAQLGAVEIVAVDNEIPAVESTALNANLNERSEIQVIFGTLSNVFEESFDVALANINRNVIVNALGVLHEKLRDNGLLIMSGFLLSDEMQIKNELLQQGFIYENTMLRGDWISIAAHKIAKNVL